MQYREAYRKGEAVVNSDFLAFLTGWLKKHIARSDMEYGPWMRGERRDSDQV